MIITREQPPMWAHPILVARHKSCRVDLAEFPDLKELNIQFIVSEQQGRGHASETVKLLMAFAKGKGWKLVSSIPISIIWEHLCKKFKLKVYREE